MNANKIPRLENWYLAIPCGEGIQIVSPSYDACPLVALGKVFNHPYWSTSTEGGTLGLPRVITRDGRDTHARTLKEITYLIKA